MLLFSGNANRQLAEKLAASLQLSLGLATITQFPDGECKIAIHENVRDKEVYIIQPTCAPVNHNILELCFLIAAIRRAGAKYIHAIVPYFAYARQDYHAQIVAQMLSNVGIDRLITVDLHTSICKKFFTCHVDNLSAADLFLADIKSKNLHNAVIVSPDVGGIARARNLARLLNNNAITFIAKRRNQQHDVAAIHVIGQVNNRDCIIIDDIIDTANTIQTTANALKANGAHRYILIAHTPYSQLALCNAS